MAFVPAGLGPVALAAGVALAIPLLLAAVHAAVVVAVGAAIVCGMLAALVLAVLLVLALLLVLAVLTMLLVLGVLAMVLLGLRRSGLGQSGRSDHERDRADKRLHFSLHRIRQLKKVRIVRSGAAAEARPRG